VSIGFWLSTQKIVSWSVHINTITSIASKLLCFSNQLKTVGGRDVTNTKTLKYKYPSFKYKYKYSGLKYKYKYLDLK